MVRADRLTTIERAILHTGRAQALAKLGRIEDTVAAVGVADEEFTNAQLANEVYWRRYSAAQQAGETGRALWDAAVHHGHLITGARHRLSAAVDGHGEEFTRARVMNQIKVASLVMATGDPCEAALIGGQVLDVVSTIRSQRVTDYLRELRRFAEPHEHLTAVAELTHRIGSVVVL